MVSESSPTLVGFGVSSALLLQLDGPTGRPTTACGEFFGAVDEPAVDILHLLLAGHQLGVLATFEPDALDAELADVFEVFVFADGPRAATVDGYGSGPSISFSRQSSGGT